MAKDLYRKVRLVIRARKQGVFLRAANGDGKVARRLFRSVLNMTKREIAESLK